MSKIIGIDLGTTNSVVAVMQGGEPGVIPNQDPRESRSASRRSRHWLTDGGDGRTVRTGIPLTSLVDVSSCTTAGPRRSTRQARDYSSSRTRPTSRRSGRGRGI